MSGDNIVDLSLVKSGEVVEPDVCYNMTFIMEGGDVVHHDGVYAVVHGGLFGPDFVGLITDLETLKLATGDSDVIPMPENYVNTMYVHEVIARRVDLVPEEETDGEEG